jgi:hypothetical protein
MNAQDDARGDRSGSQGAGHGGDARGYRWEDATPGNELALQHGANSERRVGPLAEQIAAALLADPNTPQYLREPSYSATVAAWSRAEAVVELLWRWLGEHDFNAAMADATVTKEDSTFGKGTSRKRTSTRHIESVLNQLHRHETRAMNLRSRLGLDPLSRARIGKDVAEAQVDLARVFAEMQAPSNKEGSQ